MDEHEFDELIRRYRDGEATSEEIKAIERWRDLRMATGEYNKLAASEKEEIRRSILYKIESRRTSGAQKKAPVHISLRWKTAWQLAASVLVITVVGYGAFYSIYKSRPERIAATEIAPGSDKAILVLADGRQVSLNGSVSTIPQQGSAQIVSENGKISYQATGIASKEVYNTITTPRGGQYQLTLADGSKVWLNSVSSLEYPTSFSGSHRVVKLTGEAYFEIAKNVDMPFKVILPTGAEVQVLGTHFNVMAYEDEAGIQTTLLEGSVKVSASPSTLWEGRGGVILSPNQQASISKEGKISVTKDLDASQAVAWKNGAFSFDDTELEVIMRQISRWYDVDVTFHDDVKKIQFFGAVPRKENASAVLQMLQETGVVDFEIEGKKIIVRSVKK